MAEEYEWDRSSADFRRSLAKFRAANLSAVKLRPRAGPYTRCR